jgi:H+/gluconate symporter-like permease
MAASRWRISRAAIYGAAAGLLYKAVGLIPPNPEPPGIVVHWAYVTGEWAASAMIAALAFSLIAVIRNLVVRML